MTAIFDLHDAAYYHWRDLGIRAASLVHVDAHHDTAVSPASWPIDIGNYVRAALRHGVVGQVWWIVPEPLWASPSSRRMLLRDVRSIADGATTDSANEIAASVEGAPFRVRPGSAMPSPDGPLLLDIDVDYCLTAAVRRDGSTEPLAVPWCWPDTLADAVRPLHERAHATTIASSVTGGFTPLGWAHLARELDARLGGESSSEFLRASALLREAAVRRAGGDSTGAIAICRRAVDVCPLEPAGHLWLSEALLEAGKPEDAREAFARARTLDPFYAHPFRTRGPWLLARKRYDEAESAYRAAMATDPYDSAALTGLATVLLKRRRIAEAAALAAAAVERAPDSVDAWRALSLARARERALPVAIAARQRALSLSLAGAPSVRGPWTTNPERRLVDPMHWGDHAALGDLHARRGDVDAAVAHYRIACAGAPDERRLHRRLSTLERRRALGRPARGVLPS